MLYAKLLRSEIAMAPLSGKMPWLWGAAILGSLLVSLGALWTVARERAVHQAENRMLWGRILELEGKYSAVGACPCSGDGKDRRGDSPPWYGKRPHNEDRLNPGTSESSR